MKNIKSLICLSLLSLIGSASFAQLSDRINNPSKFKTGTRPIQGDMGVFIGYNTANIKLKPDSVDNGIEEITSVLPDISIKYYVADDLVFRAGVSTKKEKTLRRGTIDPALNGIGGLSRRDQVSVASEFYITPAIEKHFLSSNLLDVYVVATLPLGYLREKGEDNVGYASGDFVYKSMNKMSFAYGLEAHVGLQAFIADLPLAIGAEMGISGIGYRGEKLKHVESSSIGGVETNQVYYTFKNDPQNIKYSNLKSNSFNTSTSIRITLSYYFSK
ncbi:MAG: hypothetical protein H0V01_15215 [Bacteroidetes bacterium]|nr:hypothetical protein [Bacteroidota bacterium]HET6245916.1 hypothetical protein [Bacteroidia bacterium]